MENWKTFKQAEWITFQPTSGVFTHRGTLHHMVSNLGNVKMVWINFDGDAEKTKVVNQHWKGRTVKYLGIPTGPYTHRLVAEQFIPNPNGWRFVTHLDGDKSNNSVDNLLWISSPYQKENIINRL